MSTIPRVLTTQPAREKGHDWLTFAPLVVLPSLAVAVGGLLPEWGFMWLLAGAILFGFKWATWRRAVESLLAPAGWRNAAYLLAWPGMNAWVFLDASRPMSPPLRREWWIAAGKTLAGAALLWGVARWMAPTSTWLAGWVGCLGLGLMLHFGAFHLLALAWQTVGVSARPIMDSPLAATSLTDFWSRRWNLAFRDLAHELIYRPLVRRLGSGRAMAAVFLASGVLHDLVISLPAGAGYGWPTVYFLLQGLGMHIERTLLRGHIGSLGTRLFAILVVVLPLGMLFHEPFITRVIVPFMRAVAAL